MHGQPDQHRHQQHREHDHCGAKFARAQLLRQSLLVGFVLARQQLVFLLLRRGVELYLQGRKALIELIAQQPSRGTLRQRAVLERTAPVAQVGVRRRQRVVGRPQLPERVGLTEYHQRLLEHRDAFLQSLQLMQRDAAGQLDLRQQARIRRALLRLGGAVEQFHRRIGVGLRIGDGGQPAQRVGLAADVVELPAQLERGGEVIVRRVPFLQVLVRAAEVVQRDRLFALQSGFVLSFQRTLVQMRRLGVVAHAVVDDRDAAKCRQRVLRHLLVLEQRLCTPEFAQAEGVLAAQTAQVTAREQHFGQHLIIVRAGGDGGRLLIQIAGLVVFADRLQRFALAVEHPGAQPLARGLWQQRGGRGDLLFGGGPIALRVVVAQQQSRTDLKIRIRVAAQQVERRFGLAFADLGIDPGGIRRLIDQSQRRGFFRRPGRRQHDAQQQGCSEDRVSMSDGNANRQGDYSVVLKAGGGVVHSKILALPLPR